MKWAAVLIPALLFVGCTSSHVPKGVAYEAPEGLPEPVAGPFDWEEVFAAPVDVEVTPFYTGDFKVERNWMIDLNNEKVTDKEDRDLWVPVMAYLVEHPEHGAVLIDAGLDSTFAQRKGGNFGRLARFVDFVRQEPGSDTGALVEGQGVAPEELKLILISHMHADHTAGLPELPTEAPVVAGPDALRGYEVLWYAPQDHLAGRAEVMSVEFGEQAGSEPGPVLDLFGDRSVFLISTPGHTYGNMSFLINREGGPVLLTCDATHLKEGFELGVGPGDFLVKDRAAADRSAAALKAFSEKYPEVIVKAGHEPTDWDLTRAVQELE